MLSLLVSDDHAGEDAVQVADDLVLQRRAHLELGDADTADVLHFQIDALIYPITSRMETNVNLFCIKCPFHYSSVLRTNHKKKLIQSFIFFPA